MFQRFLIIFVTVTIILAENTITEQELFDSMFIQPKIDIDAIIDDLNKNKVATNMPEARDNAPIIRCTDTPTNLPPGVPQVDNCLDGECVPHYLCINNTLITDGETLIDIRFGEDKPRLCHDYLSICCGEEDQVDKPILPPPQDNQSDECGYRNPAGIGFRINDRDGEAQYAEFPWMVAVLRNEQNNGKILPIYHCGGSLIHREVILTAAHCVADKAASELIIRAGEWDTQRTNELWPHQDRNVSKIVSHPDFKPAILYNDIALVFVSKPFDLIENVQTICLPPANFRFDDDHYRCLTSGWGKNEFGREGTYQVILKKVELPMVQFTKCQNALQTTRLGRRFQLHSSFVCAGGEAEKDACKGDGGSPLMCPIRDTEQGRYYQAGIVAWGIGCGENKIPGVYVNVALFRDWIDLEMERKNLNSSSYIPDLE